MTQKDLLHLLQDPATIPWNAACFVHAPGRYYLGMCFIEMPVCETFPKGGNTTAELWRFEAKPEWFLTFRFRYYITPAIWDSNDKRSWYASKLGAIGDGTEAAAEARFREWASALVYVTKHTLGTPSTHWLWVKGDSQKFLEVVQREKPFWLHTQQTVTE